MARGIWAGTVSFGLVAIPVELFSALKGATPRFRMLHNKDFSPLQRRMVCPRDEAVLSPDEIIRAFEVEPDKYVPVSDEELDSISPTRSRTVEIIDFVDIDNIDLVFYDRPYYLLPSKGGEKPYQLLVKILKQSKKAGLAKFVLRNREYLVALRTLDNVLSLITLHYPEDILSDEEITPAKVVADSKQKAQIKKVMDRMEAKFNPEKYKDERREKIFALLKKKEKQGTIEVPEMAEEEEEEPVDLIDVLRESLAKTKEPSA
jgi:DNA end-binding protein Ku